MGRLNAALEARAVHDEVFVYCREELLQENCFHAVFEATKGIGERIRILSGLTFDGVDLITKVLLGQSPVLAIAPLSTDSERSEQKGLANLLIGLFGAVRNPLAQTPKTVWPMTEQDALDILTLISLLQRKIDHVRKIT
ncbi:TIGR02391 family protein [Pseudomonas syringae pv. syringae]|uniref:TIGR02391 family protein n=1 Tax=Pseudomonas syringae TaxID=317 RepID=UPI00200B8078|nr:TIGR02391 family protein [Pseudomonas syringae pv. syringae]MCK9757366.1 TIGR02391 family protein [Pseudomonas syringae pv. syringae]MCK9773619.1 TIGR02391 family protein [Pseudomonas syringae pv. syringae]